MDSVFDLKRKDIQMLSNINTFSHYLDAFENVLMSMFEYKNLPDNIYTEYIEKAFIRTGTCAFGIMEDGSYYSGKPTFEGELDDYGIMEEAYIIARNGRSTIKGLVNKSNIAVGWNNSSHRGDWDIYRSCDFLTEVDKSMKCVILNSRLAPVYNANDTKEKQAIDEILANIYDGKPKTIMNNKKFEDKLNGDVKRDPMINFTTPDEITKIQYLTKFHDDIICRFGIQYGFNMQSTGKMAQQSTMELSGYDALSKVIPSDRLRMRKLFVDNINRLFGLNIEVDFSEVWKRDYSELVNNDIIDEEGAEDDDN